MAQRADTYRRSQRRQKILYYKVTGMYVTGMQITFSLMDQLHILHKFRPLPLICNSAFILNKLLITVCTVPHWSIHFIFCTIIYLDSEGIQSGFKL